MLPCWRSGTCFFVTISPEHNTPGQLIEELLSAHGWNQRVLGVVIGVDETIINKLISGKRPLDGRVALALADVFKVPAERFMDLQKKYDLALARAADRPDPGRSTRATLYGDLPIAEMLKRRWISAESVRDMRGIDRELIRFFDAKSLDEIELLPHAAKKTDVVGPVTPSQLAWIYRVRQIAHEILVPRYSPAALRAAIPRLHQLLETPESAAHAPRILMECGIRLALVETIGSAKVDGVCFWLRNGSSPVVGMSTRFDRMDNFWFVLRHELEHVLSEHGRAAMMLDVELEGDRAGTGASVSDEERVANEAAANFCVPQDKLRKFVAVKAPFFPERDMLGFAKTLKVHPGIVAGQLRHATKRYDLFGKHISKIRSFVAPTVTTDGWGDVVPTSSERKTDGQ